MNIDEEYISDHFEGDENQSNNVAASMAAQRHIQNDLVDKEVEQVIKKNHEETKKPASGYVLPADDEDEDEEEVEEDEEEDDEEVGDD